MRKLLFMFSLVSLILSGSVLLAGPLDDKTQIQLIQTTSDENAMSTTETDDNGNVFEEIPNGQNPLAWPKIQTVNIQNTPQKLQSKVGAMQVALNRVNKNYIQNKKAPINNRDIQAADFLYISNTNSCFPETWEDFCPGTGQKWHVTSTGRVRLLVDKTPYPDNAAFGEILRKIQMPDLTQSGDYSSLISDLVTARENYISLCKQQNKDCQIDDFSSFTSGASQDLLKLQNDYLSAQKEYKKRCDEWNPVNKVIWTKEDAKKDMDNKESLLKAGWVAFQRAFGTMEYYACRDERELGTEKNSDLINAYYKAANVFDLTTYY